MKIRAAILEEIGREPPYATTRPLTIDEVELALPGRGEVLVKISAAGLCHSDLSVIDGNRPRPTPMALGHEAAAVVVETGADVDDLAKGDHVVVVFVPSCGHCEPCATGRPALCEPAAAANAAGTLLSGARRITRRGVPIHHHLGRLGLRRIRDRIAALTGQDRPQRAARSCSPVRLRSADRCRRGGQHGASDRGFDRRRGWSRRGRACGAAGRHCRGR